MNNHLSGNRQLRVYLFMQFVLASGGQFLPVALSWTVLHRYHSAALNGLVLSLLVIPRLLLLPIAQLMLRGLSPRQQMIGLFGALSFVVGAWTAVDVLAHPAPMWVLAVATLLVGGMGALSLPVSYTLLPLVAGAGQIERANAASQVVMQASAALGPLVSSAILLRASLAQVLAVFTILLVVAGAAAYIRIHPDAVPPSHSLRPAMWDSAVLPVLWIVVASALLNLLLYGPLQVGMSVWVTHKHWPVVLLGITLAAFSGGGAIGALVQGWWPPRLSSLGVLWSPALLLPVLWGSLWAVMDIQWGIPIALLCIGFMTGWLTTIMLRSIYRRVMSSAQTVVFSLVFFGSALGQTASLNATGLVLAHLAVPVLMAGTGVGLLVVGIATFVMGVRIERRVPGDVV
jgi:hypothetical protein